ncbi:MAG: cyclic pyranopterin monophosphate synthase MoaC [Deltaproteobacteria bacterium]|nr:cyclic pyranopterin monophosphate synthase MoaC [Deltaproteobacteria bacterium]MCB9785999.1 cyclic pyranopterin monophosphate synthase MoaC [Deltaproteobacteria bacterium]
MSDTPDEGEPRLTHLDADGTARMVDVSAKPTTTREATARALVRMAPATREAIAEARVAKGDVLSVARLAGIMAAKRTAELIPLCHPLPLDHVSVDITLEHDHAIIIATARTSGRTGVEMEALTAASVAALTLYDMAKAIDRAMVIESVALLEKRGGRSGHWVRPDPLP